MDQATRDINASHEEIKRREQVAKGKGAVGRGNKGMEFAGKGRGKHHGDAGGIKGMEFAGKDRGKNQGDAGNKGIESAGKGNGKHQGDGGYKGMEITGKGRG